jgi:hypothetical protein
MKTKIALLVSLVFAFGSAYADEKTSDAKKADKAKHASAKKKSEKKPAQKSDKNAAQKAESSIGDWANRNKIWVRSEPRGTGQKKTKKAE